MVGRYRSIFLAFILVLGFSFSHVASACCIIIAPPLEPNPVIIVPGLLGSFNTLALLKDKEGGTWGPFPFYNVYAGLVARFETVGFVKNKDVYMAYYDWRKPNRQSAHEFLAPIIAQAKEKTGQVDIVAHSMGGLVVQEYMKSDDYQSGEIGKFVMLGTPNEGASSAYLPWEGGVLPTSWDWLFKGYLNWIEGNLRTSHNEPNLKNPAGYRRFFPSLKELLPSTPFLVKDGGSAKLSEFSTNPILQYLHDNLENILNDVDITTIAGNGEQTLGTIALTAERTDQDKALDRWRDGHPTEDVPTPNTDKGDSTVLKSSALIDENTGAHNVTVDGVTHINLPEKAQDEVLTALGIVDTHEKQFIYKAPKSIFGLAVLSPVSVVIIDPAGKTVSKDVNDYGDDAYISISPDVTSDDPKVIILQNVPNGTYDVQLTGTGTGEYHVVVTYGDENGNDAEKTLTGTTTLGKEESFTVIIDDDSADVSDITPESPTTPDSGSSSNTSNGDKDCCPGKDPVQPTKKIGRVLGSSIKKHKPVTLEELKPLNDTFFSVYNRMPTFAEWQYWARRYEYDKRDWKAIYGAMCWRYARR